MSKIKEALKKAKQERDGVSSPATAATRSTGNGAFEVSHTGAEKSQTRSINYAEAAVKKHHLITPYLESTELIERFRLLRTKILTETEQKDERTILVTSALAQEGKTFAAINLAITVAREVDQTVMLVDTNFKNPSILSHFGIKAEKGLSDYLLHDTPLSDLLVRPGIEKLVILPAGRKVEQSAELLRSIKMQKLAEEMKSRYAGRYVFFDSPAMLNSVDSIVLGQYVDKILFVVESGGVSPDEVTEALDHLDREKILGTILNKKIA
ncbi:MAG: hypothetical protein GY868_13085 [Deltaproteobacteria bacterium]|nr:hypothetical protein [Deltaproteobacteria bacterium]